VSISGIDRQAYGVSADRDRAIIARVSEPAPATIVVVAHEVRGDGGMERAMLEAVSGLLERGWEVTLLARVCELAPRPGLRWIRVPTPRGPFALAFPAFALVAGAVLARVRGSDPVIALGAIVPNRVDVITVQFCQAGFAATRLHRSSRAGRLWRCYGRLALFLALGLERWCYRPSRVRRMTAVSELVRDELRVHYRLESVPIDVIPNGADAERFRPDPERRRRARERLRLDHGALVAAFVGGDWPRKGLGLAIEAVAQAGWTLLVAGGGDAARWRAAADAQGADVRFLGHTSRPEQVLWAADAFLLPSRYEGFALVTVEAAAAGLPLLVTAATGAAGLAERAGGGALPREAAAFAAQLRRLGADPALRAALGERARAAAGAMTWPRIVDAYARAYGSARVGSLPGPGAAPTAAMSSEQIAGHENRRS
jgi:UDP-glucose:(heptosyl)LPS alpha-1,3-glucosyltransferase